MAACCYSWLPQGSFLIAISVIQFMSIAVMNNRKYFSDILFSCFAARYITWLLKVRQLQRRDIDKIWTCKTHIMYRQKQYTVRCRCNAVNLTQKSSQYAPHSSPVRARYGVSFVGINYNVCNSSVFAVLCPVSCYVGPWYNGTRL